MKQYSKLIVLLLLIIGITGCGQDLTADTTTLIITKEEQVTHVMVESFNELEYDKYALQVMIQEEVDAYNLSKGIISSDEDANIQLTSLNVESQVAEAVMTYASAQDYVDFNSSFLFVGSMAEALGDGYLEKDLVLVSNGTDETYAYSQLSQELFEEYTVVISDEQLVVRTPNKIKYYTEGLTLVDDKNANSNAFVGQVVVVY